MFQRIRRHLRPRRLVGLFLLLALVWGGLLFAQAWHANHDARQSLPDSFRRALEQARPKGDGSPYTVLMVGTDDSQPGRAVGRADSITLLRIDPGSNDVATLSVPRNLAVRIPDGERQLAHLMQAGGIPRIVRVLDSQLGLRAHHVMHVDTKDFARIVDEIGGVEVRNPTAVRRTWREHDWNFRKGRVELDGDSALAFARLRDNDLDEHESDSTRGLRQQLVVSAIADRMTSPTVLLRPNVLATAVRSVRTDMTLMQLARAGLAVRSGRHEIVRCRLGGSFRGTRRLKETEQAGRAKRDPVGVARPGFLLGSATDAGDPFLLDASPRNERTIRAFLDGRSIGMDRTDPAYPTGCA